MNALSSNKPFDLGVLCNISNINNYITTVMRLPMLTREEEFEYARLARAGDDHALHQLVLSHLRLVTSISREFLNYGLPQANLIQEGNIGLMRAAKGFDPEHGFRFTTYAIQWIKFAMHEYVIRNWRMVKCITTKAHRKLFFNLRSRQDTFKPMTQTEIDEMAERLNVPRRDVAETEARLRATEVTIDAPTKDEEGSDYDPANDSCLATTDTEPSNVLATNAWRKYLSADLSDALDKLNARERRILAARWLNEDDEAPLTLKDLGTELGVSHERVRQIEVATMTKLRAIMQDYREMEVA